MGGHDQGFAGGAAQFQQQIEDGAAGALIKVAGGLVGEDERRIMDKGAGDGDTLLFAAAQFVGIAAQSITQADAGQQIGGAAMSFAIAAGQFNGQAHIFQHRQGGDQVEELEDDADVAPSKERAFVVAQPGEIDVGILVADQHLSACRLVDPRNQIEQRTLAAARLAEKTRKLSFREAPVNRCQHLMLLPGFAIGLAQPAQLHQSRQFDHSTIPCFRLLGY